MLGIEPLDVKKRLGEVVLLDVRTDGEWSIVHLDALHIPLPELGTRYPELPKDKEIICYCHHGFRSLDAAAFLVRAGYNAKSLSGGIDAWSKEVDTTLLRY